MSGRGRGRGRRRRIAIVSTADIARVPGGMMMKTVIMIVIGPMSRGKVTQQEPSTAQTCAVRHGPRDDLDDEVVLQLSRRRGTR